MSVTVTCRSIATPLHKRPPTRVALHKVRRQTLETSLRRFTPPVPRRLPPLRLLMPAQALSPEQLDLATAATGAVSRAMTWSGAMGAVVTLMQLHKNGVPLRSQAAVEVATYGAMAGALGGAMMGGGVAVALCAGLPHDRAVPAGVTVGLVAYAGLIMLRSRQR
jgi:hypothetical protein